MTFLEKLKIDQPKSNIHDDAIGIGCPKDYGYECGRPFCKGFGIGKTCTKCWNREMPDAEIKEWLQPYSTPLRVEEYNKGLNDAWELAKRIYEFTCDELEEIFGVKYGFHDLISKYTPQEALAKLKEYEDSKIEVGDIVLIYGEEAVVTKIADEWAYVLFSDGITNSFMLKEIVGDKTGKHLELASILEQIGE